MKDEIILTVFDFIETKQNQFAIKAKELLEMFAKEYHVPIKKTVKKPDLKQAVRAFIDNGKGYVETIPNLYNAL
jgi:GTP cyclohydrolase FolE2